MTHRLAHRLDQLEAATEKLLAQAEALGTRSHQAPATGQWSAAQVVHHLLVAETGIVGRIEKKLAEAPAGRPRLPEVLRARLIAVLFSLPGTRVRAPRKVGELTDQTTPAPLADLRAEWQALRQRLERVLNEFPADRLRLAVFRHPVSGQMTIEQTLAFMHVHVRHHQQQLGRIRKALGGR